MIDIRDPLIENIGAIITILAAILAFIYAIWPDFRAWVISTIRKILSSRGFWIGVSFVLILLLGIYLGGRISKNETDVALISTDTPTETAVPPAALQPTITTQTLTSIPPPTQTFSPTPLPAVWSFNFESSTHNWNTSEGEFKLAELRVGSTTYSGESSLELITELRIDDQQEVLRHTEAVAYLNNAVPEGALTSGPYNLTGKDVSCWVYLPTNLASSSENPEAYIRLFVKDSDFRNEFGPPINITPSNTNKWVQLSLTVGLEGSNDSAYATDKINALGIRIELHDGALLNYNAGSSDPPIYIDSCTIEAP